MNRSSTCLILLTDLPPPHVCVYPKPEPRFPTLYVMAVGTEGALGAIAPPFPQKKKFETQFSNKYNMPYLIMIHCKCDFVLLTQQE